MKIAVASTDADAISQHFGRSVSFIVFTVEQGNIVNKELRRNTHTAHAKGLCQPTAEHHHDHDHSHADIVNALRDCQVVLSRGMGWRAAEELKANGLEPCVFEGDLSPEQAVGSYLTGTLKAAGHFCRCHE